MTEADACNCAEFMLDWSLLEIIMWSSIKITEVIITYL